MSERDTAGDMPDMPRWLGLAGLLPQAAAFVVVLGGDPVWRFSALALAYAYAAVILSFLGGLWWGLAARSAGRVPAWIWIASVAPSLIALASAVPWALGDSWPGPSLVLLGLAVLVSLVVDVRLVAAGLAPAWWMQLRLPLSIGLGLLTLVIANLA